MSDSGGGIWVPFYGARVAHDELVDADRVGDGVLVGREEPVPDGYFSDLTLEGLPAIPDSGRVWVPDYNSRLAHQLLASQPIPDLPDVEVVTLPGAGSDALIWTLSWSRTFGSLTPQPVTPEEPYSSPTGALLAGVGDITSLAGGTIAWGAVESLTPPVDPGSQTPRKPLPATALTAFASLAANPGVLNVLAFRPGAATGPDTTALAPAPTSSTADVATATLSTVTGFETYTISWTRKPQPTGAIDHTVPVTTLAGNDPRPQWTLSWSPGAPKHAQSDIVPADRTAAKRPFTALASWVSGPFRTIAYRPGAATDPGPRTITEIDPPDERVEHDEFEPDDLSASAPKWAFRTLSWSRTSPVTHSDDGVLAMSATGGMPLFKQAAYRTISWGKIASGTPVPLVPDEPTEFVQLPPTELTRFADALPPLFNTTARSVGWHPAWTAPGPPAVQSPRKRLPLAALSRFAMMLANPGDLRSIAYRPGAATGPTTVVLADAPTVDEPDAAVSTLGSWAGLEILTLSWRPTVKPVKALGVRAFAAATVTATATAFQSVSWLPATVAQASKLPQAERRRVALRSAALDEFEVPGALLGWGFRPGVATSSASPSVPTGLDAPQPMLVAEVEAVGLPNRGVTASALWTLSWGRTDPRGPDQGKLPEPVEVLPEPVDAYWWTLSWGRFETQRVALPKALVKDRARQLAAHQEEITG